MVGIYRRPSHACRMLTKVSISRNISYTFLPINLFPVDNLMTNKKKHIPLIKAQLAFEINKTDNYKQRYFDEQNDGEILSARI